MARQIHARTTCPAIFILAEPSKKHLSFQGNYNIALRLKPFHIMRKYKNAGKITPAFSESNPFFKNHTNNLHFPVSHIYSKIMYVLHEADPCPVKIKIFFFSYFVNGQMQKFRFNNFTSSTSHP